MELTDPLLQDRFLCLEVLEESAISRKWRVVERSSGRRAVLETVVGGQPGPEGSTTVAESLVGAASDHVAEIWEVGLDSRGLPFLLRQEPVGIPLKDALAAEALPLGAAIETACQCLEGLEFLHQRSIWAQNLSPKDVVLTLKNGAIQAKITDTGVFRSWQETPGVTAASSVFVGRLKYAAPEQFDEAQPAGPPAGIYVLGLIMYEMLTGRFPIQGESASSLIAGHLFRPPRSFDETDPQGRLSPELRGVLASMLAKAPEDRFQSATEALSFLRPIAPRVGPPADAGKLRGMIEAAEREYSQDADAFHGADASRSADTSQGTETVRLSPEKIARMRELAAAAAGLPAVGSPADGPTAMIRQVRDQVQEEDVQRRAAEKEKARETALRVETLLRRAKSAAQLEQFQEALALVREALSLSPDHAEALMLRASLDACLRIQQEEVLERQGAVSPPVLPTVLPPMPGAERSESQGAAESLSAAAEARTLQISERDLEAARSGVLPTIPKSEEAQPADGGSQAARSADRTTTIEPIGSVTLPMAAIEEAKRRAMEQMAEAPPPVPEKLPTKESGVVDAPVEKIEAFGSVTLPMAVIQEAKRKHLQQQEDVSGSSPSAASQEAPRSTSPPPAGVTLPPMPVAPQPAAPPAPQPVAPPAPQPVAPQPSGLPSADGFVDNRPTVDRTLSDFGFGGAADEPVAEEPIAPMYPPTPRQSPRRGRPPDGKWVKPMAIVGLISALALVFALSFFLSGRWAGLGGTESSPILSMPAEDVQGTNLPPGWLALDASPWGEILGVVSASGEPVPVVGPPYTPKLLELAPGQYTLTLSHPAREGPIEVTLDVETGKTTRHSVDMEMDLDELLARSGW